MTTDLRVSVIIPVYQGADFVLSAIHSVLSQAGEDLEIIVVDDASPDDAARRVAALGDARVHLVRHPHNRGIAAARNSGLAAARGEFVAFLDQDDLWIPGRLSRQLAALAADAPADVVIGDMVVRCADGRELVRRAGLSPLAERDARSLLAHLIADGTVSLGSSLLRRSCLDAAGSFDQSIRGGADDFDMLVRLAEVGRFRYLPGATLVWRLHDGNFTSAQRMMDEVLAIIDRVAQRHGFDAAARTGRARCYYRRAMEHYVNGERAAALSDFRIALAQVPRHARARLGWLACLAGVDGRRALRLWGRLRGA